MRFKDIKIGLFLHGLYGGGTERVMLNLAKGFVQRGINVDLILLKAEGPYLQEVPKEVRIIELKASRALKAFPGLIKYLKKEKPTALISAGNHFNLVSIWAKYLTRVSTHIIGTVHLNLTQENKYLKNQKFKDRLIFPLMHFFYPLADTIVTVSQGVAEDLIKITGISKNKIRVIYNPIVTPNIFYKAKENIDLSYFTSEETPIILGAGRLTKQKDFSTLIRAFAIVRRTIPAKLIILGEGEERLHLEFLIKELGLMNEVKLIGFVENPYKYMARAKVFVLSSVYEGFGNVIVEAMACGCPVISTNCPSGPSEILENGKYGILVPVGNELAIANAIIQTLKNPPNSEFLKKRANDFSLDKMVEEYLKLLSELGCF